MKKIVMFACSMLFVAIVWGQSNVAPADTAIMYGTVTVNKDPRIEMLGSKMSEAVERASVSPTGYRKVNGYRLMLMNTNDRNAVMQARARLLQLFPDQQPYVIFQAPFIKLKFGDFLSKADAERARRIIVSSKIVTNNTYIVSEPIIVKADKVKQEEEK